MPSEMELMGPALLFDWGSSLAVRLRPTPQVMHSANGWRMEMERASNTLIIVAFGGRTMAIEHVKFLM